MYHKCFRSYTRQIESTYAHLRALLAVLDHTTRTPSLVMEDDFGIRSVHTRPRNTRGSPHAHFIPHAAASMKRLARHTHTPHTRTLACHSAATQPLLHGSHRTAATLPIVSYMMWAASSTKLISLTTRAPPPTPLCSAHRVLGAASYTTRHAEAGIPRYRGEQQARALGDPRWLLGNGQSRRQGAEPSFQVHAHACTRWRLAAGSARRHATWQPLRGCLCGRRVWGGVDPAPDAGE